MSSYQFLIGALEILFQYMKELFEIRALKFLIFFLI